MASRSPLPVGTIPLCSDAQLCVRAVEDPVQRGRLVLDVRLERRSSADLSATAFTPTAAGFRCPLHTAELLADEIVTIARRASKAQVWEP
jgi:hypothetical protein